MPSSVHAHGAGAARPDTGDDIGDGQSGKTHSWYVVRTHCREEARAEANLAAGGFPTFFPRMKIDRRRKRANEVEPLFPQYIFVRFDANTSLRSVCFARGVQTVVKFGGSLARMDDGAIKLLQSRVDADGFVRVGEELRPGDRILIESGPFASLIGVIERHVSDKERVMVLLNGIGGGMRVEVPVECLHKAS
jgi:transcriptional antiterminator RfaH